jgi:hypothetical protein
MFDGAGAVVLSRTVAVRLDLHSLSEFISGSLSQVRDGCAVWALRLPNDLGQILRRGQRRSIWLKQNAVAAAADRVAEAMLKDLKSTITGK